MWETAGPPRFREHYFAPAQLALTPRGVLRPLPAFSRWFKKSSDEDKLPPLNSSYLLQFGDPMVPLEMTSLTTDGFHRFKAPLSFFVRWTETATPNSSERLYLAQAPVADLPQELQADLPTPDLVFAGRGDVYDTNLWVGLAPTYTPLHCDPNPNLFVQISGKKLVRLYEPLVGSSIFRSVQQRLGRASHAAIRGEEMMLGAERNALEEAVWHEAGPRSTLDQESYEVSLQAGDALFIPKGWWHSIKGLESGIITSVNWWFR
ncbi:MAG: hypothetical protein M1815_001339 [Lichina confinis]|nr:MAG: hypothetical protein M1815_001339 [Lichina confinis]